MARLLLNRDSPLTASPKKGRILLANNPVFLIPSQTWVRSLEMLEGVFSSGALTILSLQGEHMGSLSAEDYLAFPLKERVRVVKSRFSGVSRWGFGRYKTLEFTVSPELRVRFRLAGCPIYEFLPEWPNGVRMFGYFLRGFYKGFFSKAFGVKAACEETTCAAEGYGFCEFRVTRSEDKASACKAD